MSDGTQAWVRCVVHADEASRQVLPLWLVEWGAGGVEEVGEAVAAYYAPERRAEVDECLATLREVPGARIEWRWEEVAAVNWWESWKTYFHPLRVSPRLWLCPTWEVTEPPEPGMSTLLLDPGRAFGTGGHDSTRLCLEIMDDAFARDVPESFLDVGAGSGILTLAARKLGVGRCVALDIDPLAASATRENCDRNGVGGGVTVLCGDLRSLKGRHPFVAANILYQVILGLAPELKAHVAPGGSLVLSGFLSREVESAELLFRRLGFVAAERRDRGEWGALRLTLAEP